MQIVHPGADGSTPLLVLQPFSNCDITQDPASQYLVDQLKRLGHGFVYATVVDEIITTPPVVDFKLLNANMDRLKTLINPGVKVLCVVGQNLTKLLSPTFSLEAATSRRILHYPTEFKLFGGLSLPGLGISPPQRLYTNYTEKFALDGHLAKLKMMLDGRRYGSAGKVRVLEKAEEIQRFIAHLLAKHKGYVACDTETRNLNTVNHTTLCTMQFALDDETGYVIYWNHEYNTRDREYDNRVLRPLFQKLFTSPTATLKGWVFHNAQFDLAQLRSEFGTEMTKPVFDTMLMLHMMDQNRKDGDRLAIYHDKPYSLKQCSLEMLGFHGYDSETLAARRNGVVVDLPKDKLDLYAGQDGFVTFRLFIYLITWARFIGYVKQLMLFETEVHSPALTTFTVMSQNGMDLDRDHLETMRLPTSKIQEGLRAINNKMRKDPMVRAVNNQLVCEEMNAKHFWGDPPFVFSLGKPKHKTALFFHSDLGRRYPPLMNPKTKKEEYTCAKLFTSKYKGEDHLVKILSEYSEMEKLNNAYVTSLSTAYDNAAVLLTDYADGKAHCAYVLAGTQTGRLACFAAGTPIEVVRDSSKLPVGVAIEDVKAGDLVYCLDKQKRPALGRVSWAGQTGTREVVRVYWRSHIGRKGSVLCTPEHRFRTLDRGWVTAARLRAGESVYALSRTKDNLLFTGKIELRDHRFVWEQSNRRRIPKGYVVHHKDHNHYNNDPGNLEVLSLSAHKSHHGTKVLTRYSYLRLLASAAGRPVRADRDYTSLVEHGLSLGVDWRLVKFRYGADRRYISRARIVRAFEEYGSTTNKALFDDLRVGSRRLKELCCFYGIPYGTKSKKTTKALRTYHGLSLARNVDGTVANNHVILGVEATGLTVPVYDLTVDKHHCFYAGELLAHNCIRPNLQQIPRAETPLKKEVKNIFRVDPDGVILQADFAAAEVRMWGSLSHDKFLIDLLTQSYDMRAAYRENPLDEELEARAALMADIHKQTAALMFNVAIEAVDKPLRSITKSIVFGLIYGRGIPSIAEQLGKSVEETEALCAKFFQQFPDGVAWLEQMKEFCMVHGYVETPFGRRRYLPFVFDEDRGRQQAALRRSINTPVQSTTGDFATLSIALLHNEIKRRRLSKHFWLVNAVHDSTLIRVPKSANALAEIAPIVRDCFTVKSREILRDKFGFWLEAPMDIDLEVSQDWCWRCCDCGNHYKAYKEKCDGHKVGPDGKPLVEIVDGKEEKIPCKSIRKERVELNSGWGTLIGIAETSHGYAKAATGFSPRKMQTKTV